MTNVDSIGKYQLLKPHLLQFLKGLFQGLTPVFITACPHSWKKSAAIPGLFPGQSDKNYHNNCVVREAQFLSLRKRLNFSNRTNSHIVIQVGFIRHPSSDELSVNVLFTVVSCSGQVRAGHGCIGSDCPLPKG